MGRPSDTTIKQLMLASSNVCAFPGCNEPLMEGKSIVGQVCHIKSAGKKHKRYDPGQSEEERHGFDNLVMLCGKHHKMVDTEIDRYPASLLTEMKKSHEANPKNRVVISDEAIHKLGAMLARLEVADAPTTRAEAFPDWTIRELFFHIRPDLLDNQLGYGEEKSWESTAKEVMDHFSTGRLKVWGRPILKPRRRGPLKPVDDPGYWAHARPTYWFLKEDGRENSHMTAAPETGLPDYADLQVNHEEALKIWPEPGAVKDGGPEIGMLEAARRVYSNTRNDAASSFAEMGEATDKQILTWYCTWIAQHMPMFGCRRPSTKVEPVTLEDPAKDWHIQGNTLTLRERNGHVVWENLRVKFDQLPTVVALLKATGRET